MKLSVTQRNDLFGQPGMVYYELDGSAVQLMLSTDSLSELIKNLRFAADTLESSLPGHRRPSLVPCCELERPDAPRSEGAG